jgi:hypothetical protein
MVTSDCVCDFQASNWCGLLRSPVKIGTGHAAKCQKQQP